MLFIVLVVLYAGSGVDVIIRQQRDLFVTDHRGALQVDILIGRHRDTVTRQQTAFLIGLQRFPQGMRHRLREGLFLDLRFFKEGVLRFGGRQQVDVVTRLCRHRTACYALCCLQVDISARLQVQALARR